MQEANNFSHNKNFERQMGISQSLNYHTLSWENGRSFSATMQFSDGFGKQEKSWFFPDVMVYSEIVIQLVWLEKWQSDVGHLIESRTTTNIRKNDAQFPGLLRNCSFRKENAFFRSGPLFIVFLPQSLIHQIKLGCPPFGGFPLLRRLHP